MNEHQDAFADRDAFGLTADDWTSFLAFSIEHYSGPALLWWALAGSRIDAKAGVMSSSPFPDLLSALAGDAYALAKLASSSIEKDARAMAPALNNLHRRIATAAEIAMRLESDKGGQHGPRDEPPRPLSAPSPEGRPCRH